MKFEMILYGHKLKPVSGVVVNRWNIRTLEEQADEGLSGDFNDDGPLQKNASKVFNVSIREPEGHGEIIVYFYDLWAEKCSFIQPGDILRVSGGASMIYQYRIIDYDHPNCIVYSDDCNECQLQVDSRNIVNEQRSVSMTSACIRSMDIPVDDFSHRKRKRASSSTSTSTSTAAPPSAVRGTVHSAHAYEYTPLAAIEPGMTRAGGFNLYGIVLSYQHPKPCRGSHKFSASYTLISPPLPTTEGGTMAGYEQARPVHLIYFADELEHFPQVDCVGDVVRLHRVTVGSYQGLPQIVGRQYKSSFVVFKRRVEDTTALPLPPSLPALSSSATQSPDTTALLEEAEKHWLVMPSSPNFSFHPPELLLLFRMFDWAVGFFHNVSYTIPLPANRGVGSAACVPSTPLLRDYHVSFRKQHQQIIDCGAEDGRFVGIDCVGLVLATIDYSANTPGYFRLVLWDGTCDGLVRPVSSKSCGSGRTMGTEIEVEAYEAVMSALGLSRAYAAVKLPTDLSQDQSIADYMTAALECANSSSKVALALDDDEGSSLLGGRGVLAFSSDAHMQKLAVEQLRPGMWVRARMLTSSPLAELGSESAKVLPGSAINVLPPYHRDVVEVMQSFEEFLRTRRAANSPSVPSCPRRMMSASGESYAPLAMCLSAAAPAEFLTLVRIASWHPSSPHSFVVDRASGDVPVRIPASQLLDSESLKNSQFEYDHLVYMFSLRIYDDTALTDAVVFGKNGDALFNGVSAASYHADSRIRGELERYLERVVSEGIIFELRLITYKTFPLGAKGIRACELVSEHSQDGNSRPYIKRVAILNSTLFPGASA